MRWILLLLVVGCVDDAGEKSCPMAPTADVGTVAASAAQRCNVPGSMGTRKWYRLAATLPAGDIVQLELYDQAGAFAGGTVTTGTFPVEPDAGACGVCLRALGDKGGDDETEYVGTGGTVTITAIGTNGAPIAATITDATFAQVDPGGALVGGGCTAELARVTVEGIVVDVGGGGTGGGGTGGTGTSSCPTSIGE
jgi:hypothetical protein